MSYDSIQGQGHTGEKIAKVADFKVSLLCKFACNQKTDGA